jgi:hypothetical protein
MDSDHGVFLLISWNSFERFFIVYEHTGGEAYRKEQEHFPKFFVAKTQKKEAVPATDCTNCGPCADEAHKVCGDVY